MPVKEVAVLVVEDDDGTREVLRRLMEGEGYRVLQAGDGQAGLEVLCASREPLVVLVDWWMPRMDGLQMLEALARLAHGRRHRYVLISATYDPHEVARRGLPELLGVTLLRKPFDIEDVLAEVARQAARVARGATGDGSASDHSTIGGQSAS